MKSMRSIINNLRPVVLDLGLNAAIEWQVKDFQRRSGITCELVMMQDKELVLDDNRATALFRILQESLNNVLRHAQATRAGVQLYEADGRLYMKVFDNGVGIFPGCRRKANSFGLVGIKERISTLGGELVIESGHNQGTSLTVSIPMGAEIVGHDPAAAGYGGFEEPTGNAEVLRLPAKRAVATRKKKSAEPAKSVR
jgi:signal transduction histidine kinase